MSAIDTIESIVNCELVNYDFRYCFVNRSKIPYRPDGFEARTDVIDDFVELNELLDSPMLTRKRIVGVGISIQASKVCAVDVDDCFSEPFVFESIDQRGKDVLELFEDVAYCEFSFPAKECVSYSCTMSSRTTQTHTTLKTRKRASNTINLRTQIDL